MAEFPTIYSCSLALQAGSTSGLTFSFGFLARYVRIDNLGGANVYCNFQNAAASTTGFYITSCSGTGRSYFEFYEPGSPTKSVVMAGVGMQTTSTGASGVPVSVVAFG